MNGFSDKVAALILQGKIGTANFIKRVLQMWKIINVKIKGEAERSTNVQQLMNLLANSRYGYDSN